MARHIFQMLSSADPRRISPCFSTPGLDGPHASPNHPLFTQTRNLRTDLETFGRSVPCSGSAESGLDAKESYRPRDVRPDASPRRVLARFRPESGETLGNE